MSDIEYQIQQDAKRANEEVFRFIDRGDYYKKQEDDVQALKNYISALKAYVIYARIKSNVTAVYTAIDYSDDQTNARIVYSQTLFDLFHLLFLISGFYNNDSLVGIYLLSKLVQIAEKLDEYKPGFDEKELKRYANIKDYAKSVKSTVIQNEEKLDNLQPIKNESDESLKTIRAALSEICKEKVCPSFNLESSGGCFIATAAYSTTIHPDLDTFRQFRDRTLLTNSLGRVLVSVYYQIGPQLAQYVNRSLSVKKIVRFFLEKLASFMRSRQI